MSSTFHFVVLDGHAVNPGDLSWRGLEVLGSCVVYPRTAAADLVSRAIDADFVFTNKTPFSADTIERLPRLRYIGVLATGFNVVDIAAASARRIVVTNVPGYGTQSVAQHTFALLLELTQRVGHHAASVRSGRWSQNPDWCYWDGTLVELAGLTLGIVGGGRIGKAVGRIAEAFGMRVRFVGHRQNGETLESVIRSSDVVSLHCPLTPETRHLINAETLAWFKPSTFLLNTSRGPLIDEGALAHALAKGTLAGAGLDVLSEEPPSTTNPLLRAPNCLVTPHLAWASQVARRRLLQIAFANIAAFLEGRPQNVVNLMPS